MVGDRSDQCAEALSENACLVDGGGAGFAMDDGMECVDCLGDVATDDLDAG